MRDYKELIETLRSFANSYVQMFGKDESSQLMNDASDAIEDLIAALTASNEVIAKSGNRWISVEDRLPEDEKDVLSFYDDGAESRIMPANYGHGIWFDCLFNREVKGKYITHWMPLPEPPPKEDGNA